MPRPKMSTEELMSPACSDLENWMSKLPGVLKHAPIIHLAIPGSHDSVSYSLTRNSSVSPDTEPLLRQLCKLFGILIKPCIYNWSLTQHVTITDQLNDGVRYFDLRLATKVQSKDLFIVHGLYGNEIKLTLDEVDRFLTQHPQEIIILDFQHFYEFTLEAHSHLMSMLGNLFGNRLCPLPRNLKQITLRWMRENWYQVIIMYRDLAAAGLSTMWPSNSWPTPWPDTTNLDVMFSFLEENMRSRSGNTGFVTQCVLTPDAKYVARHPFSSLEKRCGAPCNRAIIPWLRKQQPGPNGINVVISDFIKMKDTPFSETVIQLNAKLIEQAGVKE